MTKPISEYATPRKCSVCQQPATVWSFKSDKKGGINLSSRSARCEEHKETK